MSGAVFRGMEPWKLDGGIIECEGTPLGLVDLHNDADVLGVEVRPSSSGLAVELAFSLSGDRACRLTFSGVSGLRITQLDHHPNDADLFHEVSHVPIEGAGVSDFEIVLAAAEVDFRAAEVEFTAG
ncbi:hypothetical protein ACFV4N_24425 [Actinosynnema sp. NPDC059797]